MATPLDALYFREVFGRHMRGPAGWWQSFYIAPVTPDMPDREQQKIIHAIRSSVITSLDHGETFYVSREITEMLSAAADRLAEGAVKLYHFEPDDFPALAGSVYFDGPVMLPTTFDSSGLQRMTALIWGQLAVRDDPKEAAILDATYSEPQHIDGKIFYSVVENSQEMQQKRNYDRWNLRHWIPLQYGVRHEPQVAPGVDEWANLMAPGTEGEPEQVRQTAMEKVYRLLYVWTHFMKTEITGHRNLDIDRQHRRVMGKEGRPIPKVRIVVLRRYASGPALEEGEGHVDWTHRWLQRGHWRQQRVGPGRSMVRPTWIAPMIKGPADKPLIVRDTVQAVVR